MKAKSKSAMRRVAIEAIVEVRDQRQIKREAEEAISDHQAEAIEALTALEMGTLSFDDPDVESVKIAATVIRPSELKFDEAKLRKRIGAQKFNRITTRTLDKSKLEEAVKNGSIDPKIVASCSEEKPKKPYIRITEKVERH